MYKDEITDEDLIALSESGEDGTKSMALSRRGTGSLFIQYFSNGLLKLSHRVRELNSFTKTKLGFHISCQPAFAKQMPTEDFITIEEAFIRAEALADQGIAFASFKTAHVSYRLDDTYKSLPYAKVWQVLQAYRKAMRGRPCFISLKSRLRKHLFRKDSSGRRRFNSFLFLEARLAKSDDLRGVIQYMREDLGLTTQCNRMLTDFSAAFTWFIKQERDSFRKTRLPFRTGLEVNPFLRMPKNPEFEQRGKDQLTDRQLWFLWHESISSMGLTGRIARLLIAMGGLRQEQFLRAKWGNFEQDHVYPSLILINKKTGEKNQFKENFYSCAFSPLALHDIIELKNLTGHHEYLFPASASGGFRKSSVDFRTQHRALTSLSIPFKKFREHIQNVYGEDVGKITMGQIRTSATTRMGDAGIPKEMRNMIQHHNLPVDISEESYNRYKDLREKTEALVKWDNYLRGLLGKPLSEVYHVLPEQEKTSLGATAAVLPRPL